VKDISPAYDHTPDETGDNLGEQMLMGTYGRVIAQISFISIKIGIELSGNKQERNQK
jgi:hypothetical protein